MAKTWYIYVLHFAEPINAYGAQHYVGMTQDVTMRMQNHINGVHSTYVHNAVKRGIPFELVQWWRVPDGEDAHVKEKRAKHIAKFLCPHCSPAVSAYKRLVATGSAVTIPPAFSPADKAA